MPPRPKVTRDDIVDAAFDLAKKDGLAGVMARDVAAAIGTSTSPIFTVFSGMDELRQAVREKIAEHYEGFGDKVDEKTPAFMRFCSQMIGFAKEEPKLFAELFINDPVRDPSSGLPVRGSSAQECRDMLMRDYGLSGDDADFLFNQFWIYTFGVCVLITNGTMTLSNAAINKLLTDEFKAQYVLIKSGNR